MSREFKAADVVLATTKFSPEFPGGKTAWTVYVNAGIKPAIPLINRAPSGAYHVIVRITVENNRSIKNVGAESNCEYGMEDEVIRCMRASPK